VREALSIEVWEKLNRLYLRLAPVTMDSIWVHSPARLFREALEDMHALEGVTYSTLSHGEGWYFLELGKHIERAQLLGRLLDVHFRGPRDGNQSTPKYFDWLVLLKFCTAFEPYTKPLYRLDPAAEDRRISVVRSGISPFHPFFRWIG